MFEFFGSRGRSVSTKNSAKTNTSLHLTSACQIICAGAVASVTSAVALSQTPAIDFDSGLIVSPAQAESYYAGQPGGLSTGPTRAITSSHILGLSRALQGDPDIIAQYIRENIATVPGPGIQHGAIGATLNGSGTSGDQAQLMVDLLRAAGRQARYVYGTIYLSNQQMSDTFGVSTTTDFETYLGGRGVPASVTSAGAVIAHFWVEVLEGSVWRVYDPSLKHHSVSDSIDLAAATGLDTAAFETAAMQGSSTGSQAGNAWLDDLNYGAISTELTARAEAFLSEMENNPAYQNLSLNQLIGVREIEGDPFFEDGVSQHPFASGSYYTWNEVPAALRTRLRIQLPVGQIDQEVFLDEYYGTRLTLKWDALDGGKPSSTAGGTYYPPPSQYRVRLYGGHTALSHLDSLMHSRFSSEPSDFVLAESPVVSAASFNDISAAGAALELTLDIPAPGEAGTYGDLHYDTRALTVSQAEIFAFTGEVTRQHLLRYERIVSSERYRDAYDNDHTYSTYDNFGSVLEMQDPDPEQLYDHHPYDQGRELAIERDVRWREWAALREHIARIIVAATETRVDHLTTLGLSDGGSLAYIDAISHVPVTGEDPQGIFAARNVYSAFSSTLEQAVIEMAFAEVGGTDIERGIWKSRGRSGANAFLPYSAIAPDTQTRRVLSGTYDGAAFPQHQTATNAFLEAYSLAGFDVYVPAYDHGTETIPFGFFVRNGSRQAFILASNTGSAAARSRKGGGATVPHIERPDFVRATIENPGPRALNVDLRLGVYTPEEGPDIAVGGPFPYGLQFRRSYSSLSRSAAPLGMGWGHNWDIYAVLGSSGYQLAMEEDPTLAAPTVAAIVLASAAADWDNEIAGLLASAHLSVGWLQDYALRSTVTVSLGGSTELFVRRADGSYQGRRGSLSSLVQVPDSGSYVGVFLAEYDFEYTGPNGDTILFEAVTASSVGEGGNPRGRREGEWLHNRFPATRWTFPYGITINFRYREHTGTLETVTNGFWWLAFESTDRICEAWPGGWQHPSIPANNPNNPYDRRHIDIYEAVCGRLSREYRFIQSVTAHAGNPDTLGNDALQTATYSISLDPEEGRLGSVQTPATGTGQTTYRYGEDVQGYLAHDYLSEVYAPGDSANPAVRISYDYKPGFAVSRVSQVQIRSNNGFDTYIYRLSGARGVVEDPVAAVSSTHYDSYGRLTRVVSPRSVRTDYEHDGRGRLVERRVSLASDPSAYESRTVYTYDTNDNRLTEEIYPSAGESGSPLVTRYVYGDLNWPHLPTMVEDPEGNQTTTLYDPVTGLVRRLEGASGEMVTYDYNALGQMTEQRVEVSQ